jgi:hypothetical protein
MAGKNTAAFGIYRDRTSAEGAVAVLRERGFRMEDISLLLPQNMGSKDLGTEKATKAPEGVAVGAGAGAAIGGTLGMLAAIGAIAIPGLGPLIAAGPIVAALAGAGAGGAVGGVTGALVGMGIPEYEAKRYEGRVAKGGVLLSVHCDNSEWTGRAKDILEQTGAEDVSSTGEKSADYAKSDRPMPRSATGDPSSRTEASSSTSDDTFTDVPRSSMRQEAESYETEWRRHYDTNMASSGLTYAECAPAYEFGQRAANQDMYRGRSFNEVEPDLRREYERSYPGTWDRVKNSVRYAWDRITGRGARTAGR